MSGELVRVVVADDHAPTRRDVREILESHPRLTVVGEAADAPEAIEIALREKPDICLLDINMPGRGVAAAWEIRARLPSTVIVMLTVSDDDRDVFASLRAGAAGYLLKDMNPDRLPAALIDVLEGRAALPRHLMARILAVYRDHGPRRRAVVGDEEETPLTSREWQVVDLMRRGLTNAEIARRLQLSPVTVRTHVNAIVRKLGVPDRAAAVERFRAA